MIIFYGVIIAAAILSLVWGITAGPPAAEGQPLRRA